MAKGKTKHEPKFQLSSSNSLGDMSNFVTEIEDQKGDRFYHLLQSVDITVFVYIAVARYIPVCRNHLGSELFLPVGIFRSVGITLDQSYSYV